jgi:hypothetical protein
MLEKLIDASIPKILTERVLLVLLFLFLAGEDYLLFTHRGNLSWLDKVLPNISTKDVMYFIMVLAVSWLFVLPSIKTILTVAYVFIFKGSSGSTYHYLTNRQLLAKAVDDNNPVAYQHLENHIKHVKTRQVVNELYLYVLMAAGLNASCEDSFVRHLFEIHPIIMFLVSLVVIYLGVAVGIVDSIDNNDGVTDIEAKNKKESR